MLKTVSFLSFPHPRPIFPGDGQVDFDEFMTILGPKLVSSEGRDGFLGNTIDSIFWQVGDMDFELKTCTSEGLSLSLLEVPFLSQGCLASCICKENNKSNCVF